MIACSCLRVSFRSAAFIYYQKLSFRDARSGHSVRGCTDFDSSIGTLDLGLHPQLLERGPPFASSVGRPEFCPEPVLCCRTIQGGFLCARLVRLEWGWVACWRW